MTVPLACHDVAKSFGDVVALNGVTCTVGEGVTALLGPNGAGKSTLIRLFVGATTPEQGRVEVFGRQPRRDVDAFDHLGLVPQQEQLFGRLDARTFVRTAATLHGLRDADARAGEALRAVDLDPDLDRPLRSYSKGMQQRVKLAQALVHDPPVLILDEPLNGLDPTQRTRMIATFRGLAAEGRTVVVSSHVLDEVERFGSRILLLGRGLLLAEGDFLAIRDALDDRPRRVRVIARPARSLAAGLYDADVVDGVQLVAEDTLVVDTVDGVRFRRELAVVARDRGVRLLEVAPMDESLESVFRDLVVRR